MSRTTRKMRMSRRDFVRNAYAGTVALAGTAAVPAFAQSQQSATSATIPTTWDLTADVVIIGAGAVGLSSAIRLRDQGVSVIVVEQNFEIGGKAICSGGQTSLGGGTAMQKKWGIEDTPDLFFKDLTDWSVVEHNKMPEYRYNDREIQRALADNSAKTYDFLIANGVKYRDASPMDVAHGHAVGVSAGRGHTPVQQGPPGTNAYSPRGGNGAHIVRPLEASARAKGVRFLLNHYMDSIYRQQPTSGRVLGVKVHYKPHTLPGSMEPLKSLHPEGNIDRTAPTANVKANRAVVVATGGSAANVNFRRIFDPRLTEEYQCAVDIWAPQDGSGEIAAMLIGASLWGAAAQSQEKIRTMGGKPDRVGCRDTYTSGWAPTSPVFPLAKANGVAIRDWQNAILVNQIGKRFYDEMADGWPYGSFYPFIEGYVHGDWRNLRKVPYEISAYNDAALAMNEGSQAPHFGSGPQWAIFDSEAVKREKLNLDPPNTDPEYFFSANTLEELAGELTKNPWQKIPMPGAHLKATVERYNHFVDNRFDEDFEKPTPKYKIAVPPFYAGWGTVITHDSYAGLRINGKNQVVDLWGQVIPGLYCGGESAGGCSQHGLGRCYTAGYIIGSSIPAEEPKT
jgi:hypothetical protein